MGITGKIYGINGPVITIQGNPGYKMNEMVYVGEHRLVGEVIRLSKEKTTIQVYEETSGLKPGEEVAGAGCAISVKLAPGILNNIFDGIERPLQKIAEKSGAFIPTGAQADALDRKKLWETHITVQEGDEVAEGSIIAEVPETKSIVHRVMLPPGVSGTVTAVKPDGDYTICDEIVTICTTDGGTKALTMTQEWPIRKPRPVKDRYPADRPLVTGQRILDTLFPIAKGGTAAIPGPFGSGKTVMQHALASLQNGVMRTLSFISAVGNVEMR
jgi:V/A-type H+-transporting ATPase subunit A